MAFNDGSGTNSKACPMCQPPTALKIAEAACGTMAVKAVENEVRSSVEFDVKSELLVRKQRSVELMAASEEAFKSFHQITEEVNLKCPRCTHVFDDDCDGCNALRCSCGAAFCALCLADCGRNAPEHIRQNHPDGMFSKDMSERAKRKRAQMIVKNHLTAMKQDIKELVQLVKNHIDKVELLESSVSADTVRERIANFLRGGKKNLATAVKSDRLSLISVPAEKNEQGKGVCTDH
jgi:hypothetical protein